MIQNGAFENINYDPKIGLSTYLGFISKLYFVTKNTADRVYSRLIDSWGTYPQIQAE